MNRFLNGHPPDDALVREAIDDIQKSRLSQETLEMAGVQMFRGGRDDLKKHLGRANVNGHSLIGDFRLIEFPYFNKESEIVFYRYKVVPTTTDHNGDEVRYLHPIGKPAIPYILPSVWAVKDKVNKPVWITEGEKKALKLIQHGRYAIALSGVWNFRAGAKSDLEGDKELWQELQSFDWKGRTVYLGFDMDLWTNPMVRKALYTLAFQLQKLKAIVLIPTWDVGKGIDDHLIYQETPDSNNLSLKPEMVLDLIERKAKKLWDFIDQDHLDEIVPAIMVSFKDEIKKDDTIIKAIAKKLKISVKTLMAKLKEDKSKSPDIFPAIEPWPEPVNGNELLREIVSAINNFCILPPYGAEAVSLWVLHTYCMDAFFVTPTLTLQSAEMRSGKTTTLSVVSKICYRPLLSSNISSAAVFRAVEKWKPTLIIDEADTFLKDNEELRGILNSGHTRDTAFVIRTVGDSHEPMQFCTWAAKAIALIGKLPATLQDRSIVLHMFRKKPGENVQKLSLNVDFLDIKRKCLRWVNDNIESIKKCNPVIPIGLNDRAVDNWTPLFIIADLAGGEWPDIAQKAAVSLSGEIGDGDTAGTMLLMDIKKYFSENKTDRVTSSDLYLYLQKIEERPWPEWYHGKPITPRQVTKLLSSFGIVPSTIRTESGTAKGYKKEVFNDAFIRYTPDLSVTPSQVNKDATKRDFSSVTPKNDVTDKNNGKSSIHAGCDGVTDEKGGGDEIIEMELNL